MIEGALRAYAALPQSAEGEELMLKDFYVSFSAVCFTLLGLWLIVAQTRHAEWRGSSLHRRRTHGVAMHFSLPGLMSLLALVTRDARQRDQRVPPDRISQSPKPAGQTRPRYFEAVQASECLLVPSCSLFLGLGLASVMSLLAAAVSPGWATETPRNRAGYHRPSPASCHPQPRRPWSAG